MASSSSSNTARSRRNGRRVSLLRQPSREDEYEGQKKFCFCSLPAPRWTAWTEGNSGRRFYGCRNYYQDGGGCGYFAWHDSDFGERANTVIRELLDDIDRLYDENSVLRRGKDERILFEEMDAIRGEVRKLKYKHEMNDMQHKQGQMKFKIAMSLLLITWIWLFVYYVM